jgi:hypothetical protein
MNTQQNFLVSDEYEKREKKYYEICKRYIYFSYEPETYIEPDDWMDVKNVISSAHKMNLNELFIEYNKVHPGNTLKEWKEVKRTEDDDKKYVLLYRDNSGNSVIFRKPTSVIYTFGLYFSVDTSIEDLEFYNLLESI